MSRREVSDEQIKADLMNRLLRKHCWGAKYFPLITLVNWMSKQIKNNGKRIQRLVRQLVNEGYLLLHKKGATVSLNPTRSKEIIEYIKKILEI
jgi:hypothetical protein